MKKRVFSIFLMLIMLLTLQGGGQKALAEAQAQNVFTSIEEKYEAAFLRDTGFDLDFALQMMEKVIELYDGSSKELAGVSKARTYYDFAQGVIAFHNEQYKDTVNLMWDCNLESTQPGYDPANYIAFSQGMLLKAEGEEHKEAIKFKEAIDKLASVSVTGLEEDYNNRWMTAIKECRQLYRDTRLPQAQESFRTQEYQAAVDCCKEILDILPYDEETTALLRKAEHAGGLNTAQEYTAPVIKSAKARVRNSNLHEHAVILTWEGEQDTYVVTWTPDLVHGNNAKSEIVTGHTFRVPGLYPGTVYRFTVEYQGIKSAPKDKTTAPADKYEVIGSDGNPRVMMTGTCIMYNYEKALEDFLDEEAPAYQYYYDHSEKIYIRSDKVICPEENDTNLILLIFTNYAVSPEEIIGKEWTMLLHIDEYETLIRTGSVGDAFVSFNPDGSDNSLYVVMYDILDELATSYDKTELKGKAYTLDLLLEGKLAGTVSGTLE